MNSTSDRFEIMYIHMQWKHSYFIRDKFATILKPHN